MNVNQERARQERHDGARGRRQVWIATVGIVLGALGLGLGGAFAWHSGQQANERLCLSNVTNRAGLRGLLETAEQIALERATSEAEVERITAGYRRLFVKIPPLVCVDGQPQLIKCDVDPRPAVCKTRRESATR